jgi:hypothetical protein
VIPPKIAYNFNQRPELLLGELIHPNQTDADRIMVVSPNVRPHPLNQTSGLHRAVQPELGTMQAVGLIIGVAVQDDEMIADVRKPARQMPAPDERRVAEWGIGAMDDD